MKNKGLIATIVVLIAVIITLIAVLVLMQMPTILSGDGWAGKFLNKKETTVISTIETTEKKVVSTTESKEPIPELSTKIENYTAHNDRVSIDYPQIVGMSDKDMQDKLNNKIKTNALSIVPLYPISTAVQNLTISCEVKSLDDNYITILYSGKVVGVKASSGSSSSNRSGSSGKSSSNSVSSYPDPYLDGFVDPLAVWGQNVGQNFVAPSNGMTQNNFVAPSNNNSTTNANVEIINNGNNANTNVKPNSNSTGTADKGPVAVDIKNPTAAANRVYSENMADNNPTGSLSPVINNSYTSNGVYYSQSGTQNIAPIESTSRNSVTYSLPISGFANTNASDIDQRIFYTNTINLKTGLDMKLGDYVSDFNALAKYLRSSKVEFANISEKDRKAVREYVNKTVQSKYVEFMESADFRNEGVKAWPKIFSYREDDGTVYFSVRLSSKLGNYAIVKYKN